ncbi:MAG: DUF6049 family protein [Actinomycetota bacterium]|nr:DUF6049 family protein [Actinomycetota bacterium]
MLGAVSLSAVTILWAALAGLSPIGTPAAISAPAQGASPNPDGDLSLSYQTPWVGASGDFSLRLHLERPSGRSDPEVAVTIYPAVATRSEFALTIADKIVSAPLLPVQSLPVSALVPDAAGDVTVNLHLADRLSLGEEDGVFPVRVALRERSTARVLRQFTTHLVYLPGQHTGEKLGLALVLPVHAAAGLSPNGARQLQGIDDLVGVGAALEATASTPVTLAPTPETLATLAASTDDKAVAALKSIQQRASTSTVLAGTYVPTNLPALLAAGLSADATTQVARGTDTVATTLRVRPDARTWLAQSPLDDASLAMLSQRGVERVVTSDADLKPDTGQRFTVTQPFVLSGGERELPAVVADPGLSTYFDNGTAPALAASHLLADLAVIYLDQPGSDRRGVVAVAPQSWRVDRQLLEAAVGGLSQNPVIEPISLDTLFTGVAPAKSDSGRPAQRRVAPVGPGGLADMAAALRSSRVRLDALGSVLGPGAADHGNLDERLLLAESTDLRTNRQRQAYLDAVLAGIDNQRQAIRIPGGRSFTLTARSAEIPVTFQNRTGLTAKVVVKVQSEKLDFPQGSTQMLDLSRLNTTQRFAVVSRTSGAFPVRITLESPDGNLMIGQARFTVRSTAASGVGLAVSIGAAVFLAVWWGRHALRGRRARRLVPT